MSTRPARHKTFVIVISLIVLSASMVVDTLSAAPSDFRVSLSVSPFTETILKTGTQFTDGAVTAKTMEELQRLFVAHGANEVYARISTRRSAVNGAGNHSMNGAIERARIAKALGLPFNPELGLFASYGDIRCQPAPDFSDYGITLPGPWATLTLEQMTPVLKAYGAAAAREILATGVSVRIWDVGNEVELGLAGVAVRPMPGGCDASAGATDPYAAPDRVNRELGQMSGDQLVRMDEAARINWLRTSLWPAEAALLKAVADGIRSVDAQARFSTHVSGVASTQPRVAAAFFTAMRDGGFLVDEAGASYYPTSSRFPTDRVQAFKDTVAAVHAAIDRPTFIAEFGFPNRTMTPPFAWNDPPQGYALTPEGQAAFLRDLVAWSRQSGFVTGIRPWAPELVVPGWAPMALFARHGSPLVTANQALDVFVSMMK